MLQVDPSAASDAERAAGGISRQRYLSFLDERSSTASLGFRIDGAKTLYDGSLDLLPLPEGVTLPTLRDEAAVVDSIGVFLQHDSGLASAFLTKLQVLAAVVERNEYFKHNVFLRCTMLLAYDDAARDSKVEAKITNFGRSYALPEGETVTHKAAWDGTAASHEDGFLTGVKSLVGVFKRLASQEYNKESLTQTFKAERKLTRTGTVALGVPAGALSAREDSRCNSS
jgi:hypothetical protein